MVDNVSSAIEYRFRGKHGNDIIADLMLTTGAAPDVLWSVIALQNKSGDDLAKSDPFVAAKMDSICHVSPGFDDRIPGQKPRAEWRKVDPTNLASAQSRSPTPLQAS